MVETSLGFELGLSKGQSRSWAGLSASLAISVEADRRSRAEAKKEHVMGTHTHNIKYTSKHPRFKQKIEANILQKHELKKRRCWENEANT